MSTTAPTRRRRQRTVLLSMLLALALGVTTPVVASATVPAPTVNHVEAAVPAVSVSKTTSVNPAGETLTVTGAGFDPAGSIGTRPPLAGQQSGVYVIFGKFLPEWKPSSAPSSARYVIDQKWAAPGAPPVLVNNPQYVPLAADGSFVAEVDAREDSRGPWNGVYGVYVYPASGATNPAQEVSQPVTFRCASGPAAPERGFVPMCDTRAGQVGETIYRPSVELVGDALDVPGGAATLKVTGWAPDNDINVRFNDAGAIAGTPNGVIASATTDAAGTATLTVPLPSLAAYRQLDATYGDTGGHWLRLLGSNPNISLHLWLDPASTFPDVPLQTSDFYPEITWAAGVGVVNGYDDGTFRPVNQISRGAVAAMLYRSEHPGVTAKPLCTGAAPFADVPVGSPFCGEIEWMKTSGISTGSNGLYEPSKPLSRQAAAAFLARAWAAGPQPACVAAPFADVPVNSGFCKEIAWVKDQGISTGWPDNTFRPTNPVTRQAFVAFLYRDVHPV